MPKLPSEWKVAWLNSYLKRKGQFPQNCPSLWFDDSLQPSRVLADLFLQSTAEQISSWYASVPKECIWSFASALGIAAQRDPVKRSLLVSTIERMDDGGLCNLLDKPSGRADAILGNIDDGDSRFIARMNRFDDGIRTAAPDQVGPRVEVLLSNESHLRFLRVSLKKWKDVHEAIKRCNQCLADPSGRMAPDLKRALCEVLRAFGNALSDSERSVAAIEIDSKHVEPMLRRWLNSQRPDLLEQSIRALTALQLEATDDQSLCAFLAGKNGTAWRRGLAPGDTSLQERVQRILEELPETVSRFSEEGNEFPDGDNTLSTNGEALRVRLAGLEASREWLGAGKSHLRSWQQLMEHLGWIKDFVANAGDPNDPKARLASADLAPYVVTTIGAQLKYDPSQKAGMRLTAKRCLRNLSLAAVGYDTLIKWPIVVRAIEMEFEKRAAAKGGGFFSVFKG